MRSDGGNRRTLTPLAGSEFVTRQAWSPDRKQLVFMRRGGGIWVMKSDGSRCRSLTRNGADLYPFWSPHGLRIAFTRHVSGPPHVYVMNADGTRPRSLTTGVVEQWKSAR
jgi:Tol biopolymer transport system component